MLKKIYLSLRSSNIVVQFIVCFAVVLTIDVMSKLLSFAFGYGDFFYLRFNEIRDLLPGLGPSFESFISTLMFIGSFYGTILRSFFFVISLSIYAAFLQFVLHIFIYPPKRFSVTLSIFYSTVILFYILNIVPVIGPLVFIIILVVYAARGISESNSFSLARAFFLLFLPMLIFPLGFFLLFFSVLKVFSLF